MATVTSTRGTNNRRRTRSVSRPTLYSFDQSNISNIIKDEDMREKLGINDGQFFEMKSGNSAPQGYDNDNYDYYFWKNGAWSRYTGNDRSMEPGYYTGIKKGQSLSGTSGATTSSTSAPTGGYLHLNDRTAPVITPNYGAYTYSEWMSDTNPWGATNFDNIRSLGNIYGDIDTEEELNILAQLQGAQGAINYINSNSGENPLFVNNQFTGNADAVKRAAALLGKYAASDEGKPFYEQLRRGYASLDNMDKYKAYAATKGWTDADGIEDRNYLNEARNSVDGRYNGARFFMNYAGDKTWGTLANEFARNNRFREDYTVNGKHVMDRLNRDAGLGDRRTLIQIYNDIISKNPDLTNDDERKYRIFRDMTKRRFKLDNNFWNRYGLLPWARDNVYGTGNIRFKNGGQIFRMLFV